MLLLLHFLASCMKHVDMKGVLEKEKEKKRTMCNVVSRQQQAR
jgi:hypothetical protein